MADEGTGVTADDGGQREKQLSASKDDNIVSALDPKGQ